MAKKKSKRFIIPSFHFLTTVPPVDDKVIPKNISPSSAPTIEKVKAKESPPEIQKPQHTSEKKPVNTVKPKPLKVEQTGRRNSALSLSSLKRNKEEQEQARIRKNREQEEVQKDLPKDPFTEARFLEVWNGYVEELHKKGEKILASILKADSPKLKGHLIHLAYPNELMKVELLKVRPRVLRYIREKLNNYAIDFEITVNEDNTKRFAYTPQEKYELLKEKNKALALLRKKFNLEL